MTAKLPRQTAARFFRGHADARRIHAEVVALVRSIGRAEIHVTKSQIAFRRRRAFAWTWMPGQYLSSPRPPLVLSVALPKRDRSRRWKEVVEPYPGRFMHHLELRSEADVDDKVAGWLRTAWETAA